MELEDPFPAYNAESNMEAMLVQQFLEAYGIESHAVEDVSGVGMWAWGGGLAEVHRPQVWVSKKDEQRVTELLTEYEQRKADRDAERKEMEAKTLEADCEACGQTTSFPGSLNGTTQDCAHCGGFVDVGTFDWPYEEGFGEVESEGGEPA